MKFKIESSNDVEVTDCELSEILKLVYVDECEMHLLGVKSEFRGLGLGKRLVEAILEHAENQNWSKMILWTQENMVSAQHLYEACGFSKSGKMTRNRTSFIVYEKRCT